MVEGRGRWRWSFFFSASLSLSPSLSLSLSLSFSQFQLSFFASLCFEVRPKALGPGFLRGSHSLCEHLRASAQGESNRTLFKRPPRRDDPEPLLLSSGEKKQPPPGDQGTNPCLLAALSLALLLLLLLPLFFSLTHASRVSLVPPLALQTNQKLRGRKKETADETDFASLSIATAVAAALCSLPPLTSFSLIKLLQTLFSQSVVPPWLLSPRSSCSASGPTRTSRYEKKIIDGVVDLDVVD